MSNPQFVRARLTLPADMNARLEAIGRDKGKSFGEVVQQALTLYFAAHDHHLRGYSIGFARPEQKLEVEVLGI